MRTNENIAIGLFKEQMIKLILEKDAERRRQLLFELQAEMEEHILPQRKLPGKERKRISQTNIKIIKKAVFKKSMQFPWGKSGLFSYNTVL
ncbi:MAG: hypothetical protein ACLVHS_10050 [Blautia wexlerae]